MLQIQFYGSADDIAKLDKLTQKYKVNRSKLFESFFEDLASDIDMGAIDTLSSLGKDELGASEAVVVNISIKAWNSLRKVSGKYRKEKKHSLKVSLLIRGFIRDFA